MNRQFLLISFVLFSVTGFSQPGNVTNAKQVTLQLPKMLQTGKMEFSSMAWYRKDLLMIPQFPDHWAGEVYSISKHDLSRGIRKEKPIKNFRTWLVDGLDKIKQKIGPSYEGVEATLTIGRNMYFTIESKEDDPDCYLVAGKVFGDRLVLDPERIIRLPKEKRLGNAGFESLAYWPKKNQLLAFFEYNKEAALAKIQVIDLKSFTLSAPISLPALPFRITDMVYAGEKKGAAAFWGINHLYDGKKENNEYVGRDSIDTDEPSLAGKNLKHTNYTRIMQLFVSPGFSFAWKKLCDVDFTSANWEGIAAFRKGALIVTDEYPESVLKWISW